MNLKKLILISLSVLLVLIFIAFIGLYILFRSSLPQREGEIQLSGIHSEISIYFDEKGIPQIWADNEEDAWYAVGWLHASDRLFQMELTRRVAYGRLSEFFGDLTLDFDRKQRIIGHHVIAEKDLVNLKDSSRRFLEAYSAGINQWVRHVTALPFEFQVLNAEFEPWSVKDCLAIFSFQTWFIDELQNNEDFYLRLEKETGKRKADELIPSYPKTAPKTVPQFEKKDSDQSGPLVKYAANFQIKESIVQSLFSLDEFPFVMTRGSNAWAVSGSKTSSGNALFCSDPHLELIRLPQFWYIIGIHTYDSNIETVGITSPGIPLIAMGHNGKISWAFTAAGTDVTDEYIEKLNPENPNEYLVENTYESFETRSELIKISGKDSPDTLQVKISRHGPVIYENDTSNTVISLRWAGFDFSVSEGIRAGFQMLKCNNFSEFRKWITNFGALDANWMYADRRGNIGYQLGTPIPVRREGTGRSRMNGWDGKSDWSGYYPIEMTPYAYNPSRGWLATCNNQPDDENLDYSLNGNFADDRIRRISELLSQPGTVSTIDMKTFQNDLKSSALLMWKEEVVNILKNIDENDWANRIDQWENTAGLSSKEVALIEIWLALLKEKTFADEFPDLSGKFLNKLLFRERNFYSIYRNNNSTWFDNIQTVDKVETRDELAGEAMRRALTLMADRSWGEVNSLTMAHPLAAVPLLSYFLSLERGPFPREGTSGSLNNSISFWNDLDAFKTVAGPSWRFILDFDDIDGAQMVLPAGQSGHPLSDHFFDFYNLWEKGEYWTVPFSKDKVESFAVSVLRFVPDSD